MHASVEPSLNTERERPFRLGTLRLPLRRNLEEDALSSASLSAGPSDEFCWLPFPVDGSGDIEGAVLCPSSFAPSCVHSPCVDAAKRSRRRLLRRYSRSAAAAAAITAAAPTAMSMIPPPSPATLSAGFPTFWLVCGCGGSGTGMGGCPAGACGAGGDGARMSSASSRLATAGVTVTLMPSNAEAISGLDSALAMIVVVASIAAALSAVTLASICTLAADTVRLTTSIDVAATLARDRRRLVTLSVS